MSARAFIDTSIWVYAVDSADPAKQARAAAVLSPSSAIEVVVSGQVLGEFFVTVTQKLEAPLTRAKASALVDRMRRLQTVPIDGDIVAAAVECAGTCGISYWDALIVATASAAGCDVVLSEDLADGRRYGQVRVENPLVDRRRLSESRVPYEAGAASWDEPALRAALAGYAAACRDAGMKPNAVNSYWDHARRFLDWRTGAYRPRGAAEGVPPVSATVAHAKDLASQAGLYADAVAAAGLGADTVDTYRRHAGLFVRWLDGDFRPGARIASR